MILMQVAPKLSYSRLATDSLAPDLVLIKTLSLGAQA